MACLFVYGKLVAAAEAEPIPANQTLAELPTHAIDNCLRGAGLTINAVNHIAINRNSSSLAKATRAMKASSRWKLVGLELAALCYGLGSYPEETNRRAMFFSICVSEPDYPYILRRC